MSQIFPNILYAHGFQKIVLFDLLLLSTLSLQTAQSMNQLLRVLGMSGLMRNFRMNEMALEYIFGLGQVISIRKLPTSCELSNLLRLLFNLSHFTYFKRPAKNQKCSHMWLCKYCVKRGICCVIYIRYRNLYVHTGAPKILPKFDTE